MDEKTTTMSNAENHQLQEDASQSSSSDDFSLISMNDDQIGNDSNANIPGVHPHGSENVSRSICTKAETGSTSSAKSDVDQAVSTSAAAFVMSLITPSAREGGVNEETSRSSLDHQPTPPLAQIEGGEEGIGAQDVVALMDVISNPKFKSEFNVEKADSNEPGNESRVNEMDDGANVSRLDANAETTKVKNDEEPSLEGAHEKIAENAKCGKATNATTPLSLLSASSCYERNDDTKATSDLNMPDAFQVESVESKARSFPSVADTKPPTKITMSPTKTDESSLEEPFPLNQPSQLSNTAQVNEEGLDDGVPYVKKDTLTLLNEDEQKALESSQDAAASDTGALEEAEKSASPPSSLTVNDVMLEAAESLLGNFPEDEEGSGDDKLSPLEQIRQMEKDMTREDISNTSSAFSFANLSTNYGTGGTGKLSATAASGNKINHVSVKSSNQAQPVITPPQMPAGIPSTVKDDPLLPPSLFASNEVPADITQQAPHPMSHNARVTGAHDDRIEDAASHQVSDITDVDDMMSCMSPDFYIVSAVRMFSSDRQLWIVKRRERERRGRSMTATAGRRTTGGELFEQGAKSDPLANGDAHPWLSPKRRWWQAAIELVARVWMPFLQKCKFMGSKLLEVWVVFLSLMLHHWSQIRAVGLKTTRLGRDVALGGYTKIRKTEAYAKATMLRCVESFTLLSTRMVAFSYQSRRAMKSFLTTKSKAVLSGAAHAMTCTTRSLETFGHAGKETFLCTVRKIKTGTVAVVHDLEAAIKEACDCVASTSASLTMKIISAFGFVQEHCRVKADITYAAMQRTSKAFLEHSMAARARLVIASLKVLKTICHAAEEFLTSTVDRARLSQSQCLNMIGKGKRTSDQMKKSLFFSASMAFRTFINSLCMTYEKMQPTIQSFKDQALSIDFHSIKSPLKYVAATIVVGCTLFASATRARVLIQNDSVSSFLHGGMDLIRLNQEGWQIASSMMDPWRTKAHRYLDLHNKVQLLNADRPEIVWSRWSRWEEPRTNFGPKPKVIHYFIDGEGDENSILAYNGYETIPNEASISMLDSNIDVTQGLENDKSSGARGAIKFLFDENPDLLSFDVKDDPPDAILQSEWIQILLDEGCYYIVDEHEASKQHEHNDEEQCCEAIETDRTQSSDTEKSYVPGRRTLSASPLLPLHCDDSLRLTPVRTECLEHYGPIGWHLPSKMPLAETDDEESQKKSKTLRTGGVKPLSPEEIDPTTLMNATLMSNDTNILVDTTMMLRQQLLEYIKSPSHRGTLNDYTQKWTNQWNSWFSGWMVRDTTDTDAPRHIRNESSRDNITEKEEVESDDSRNADPVAHDSTTDVDDPDNSGTDVDNAKPHVGHDKSTDDLADVRAAGTCMVTVVTALAAYVRWEFLTTL